MKQTLIILFLLTSGVAISQYSAELGNTHANARCAEYLDLLIGCGVGDQPINPDAVDPREGPEIIGLGAGSQPPFVNSFCRTDVENTYHQELQIVLQNLNNARTENDADMVAYWTAYWIGLVRCGLQLGLG